MKLKRGAWDGAQPRGHVLKVLREHGVEISHVAEQADYYMMIDLDGDPHVQHLPNPVLSEVIVAIFRRFGNLHGFEITDLVVRKKH